MALPNWYFMRSDTIVGPVHEERLLEMLNDGSLTSETPISSTEMSDWKPAGHVFSIDIDLDGTPRMRLPAKHQMPNRNTTFATATAAKRLRFLAVFLAIVGLFLGWQGYDIRQEGTFVSFMDAEGNWKRKTLTSKEDKEFSNLICSDLYSFDPNAQEICQKSRELVTKRKQQRQTYYIGCVVCLLLSIGVFFMGRRSGT